MRRVLVGALTLAALAACGTDSAPGSDTWTLPIGEPAYDPAAPTWAVGTEIHVGDTVVEADPAPDAYVVTRAGIYYTHQDTLYATDGTGPAERVADLRWDSLAVSPDGRYLATIDQAHGPTDGYDEHVGVPVAFDLDTGAEVLRPGPGRDLGDDDLRDLYEDAELGLLGVTGDDDPDGAAAYAIDPLRDGLNRFPLDGSDPDRVDDAQLRTPRGWPTVAVRRDGGLRLPRDPAGGTAFAVLSPARDALFSAARAQPRWYTPDTGEAHAFDTGGDGRFLLGGWTDDRTFYGLVGSAIVRCSLDATTCTTLATDVPSGRVTFGDGEPVYR